MEAFSVLAAATSIASFLDLGAEILSGAISLYTTPDGSIKPKADEALIEACDALSRRGPNGRGNNGIAGSSDEVGLGQLAMKCKVLGEDLEQLLGELKADLKRRSFNTPQQPPLAKMKKTRIYEHWQILNEYRAEFLPRLTSIFRDDQSRTSKMLEDVAKKYRDHDIQCELQTSLIRHQIIVDADYLQGSQNAKGTLHTIYVSLIELQSEARDSLKRMALLSSLRYDAMRERESSIAEAHKRTFEWILAPSAVTEASRIQFIDWLESQSSTYWITGKPGCGKSTLMKYVSNNRYTAALLKSWANKKTLLTANYYFWRSGASLQRKQEGLFRSLLYEVFCQAPELITKICRSRLKAQGSSPVSSEPWTREELAEACSELKSESIESYRICFFVDGLDEYDGDYFALIDVIKDLVSSPHIKICVSSRPSNEFDNAFGRDRNRRLLLHGFTQNDIRIYVMDELKDQSDLIHRCYEEFDFHDLMQDIIDRAHGVFLWVYLVTRSLLRSMHEEDDLDEFQRVLRELPTDLEEYFRYVLDSTEEYHQSEAARILLLCLESDNPPTAMTLSYSGETDDRFALDLPPCVSRNSLKLRHDEAMSRINARCGDLLEIHRDTTRLYQSSQGEGIEDLILGSKVEFLHRTVRDYLADPSTKSLLYSRLRKPLSPHLYFCNATLCQIASLSSLFDGMEPKSALPKLVKEFMANAAQIELKDKRSENKLLERLEQKVTRRMVIPLKSLVRSEQTLGESDQWLKVLAVQNGLCIYITEYLRKRMRSSRPSSHPLLDFALRLPFDHTAMRQINLQMVSILLEAGADPNEIVPLAGPFRSMTVWQLFLASRWSYKEVHGFTTPERKANAAVISALLANGADPEASFTTVTGLSSEPTPIHAFEAINQVCSMEDLDVLERTAYKKSSLRAFFKKVAPSGSRTR